MFQSLNAGDTVTVRITNGYTANITDRVGTVERVTAKQLYVKVDGYETVRFTKDTGAQFSAYYDSYITFALHPVQAASDMLVTGADTADGEIMTLEVQAFGQSIRATQRYSAGEFDDTLTTDTELTFEQLVMLATFTAPYFDRMVDAVEQVLYANSARIAQLTGITFDYVAYAERYGIHVHAVYTDTVAFLDQVGSTVYLQTHNLQTGEMIARIATRL